MINYTVNVDRCSKISLHGLSHITIFLLFPQETGKVPAKSFSHCAYSDFAVAREKGKTRCLSSQLTNSWQSDKKTVKQN